MAYTSPRPRLRPLSLAILETRVLSVTEPTYVGPDRTALDDVTVQACAMGYVSGLKNMPSILIFRP